MSFVFQPYRRWHKVLTSSKDLVTVAHIGTNLRPWSKGTSSIILTAPTPLPWWHLVNPFHDLLEEPPLRYAPMPYSMWRIQTSIHCFQLPILDLSCLRAWQGGMLWSAETLGSSASGFVLHFVVLSAAWYCYAWLVLGSRVRQLIRLGWLSHASAQQVMVWFKTAVWLHCLYSFACKYETYLVSVFWLVEFFTDSFQDLGLLDNK